MRWVNRHWILDWIIRGLQPESPEKVETEGDQKLGKLEGNSEKELSTGSV